MMLGIYGSGGLGRELAEIAKKNNSWEKIFFIDDTKEDGILIDYFVCYTYDSFLLKYKNDLNSVEVIVGVGEPQFRQKLYNKLKNDNIRIATLVSKYASVSDNCKISEGTIICEFATIHTGVRIGRNTLIQPNAVIGHDIEIGEHSVLSAFFSPGGDCKFGNRVYAGMHSVVKEKTNIGNDVIIGMGSVVYKDVNDGQVVVGNPGRVTLGNENHFVFK